MSLEKLKQIVEQSEEVYELLKDQTKEAREALTSATETYNLAKMADLGFSIGDIVHAPGRSSWRPHRDVVIEDVSTQSPDHVMVREVTKDDKVHAGRRAYVVPFERVTSTGRLFAEDDN